MKGARTFLCLSLGGGRGRGGGHVEPTQGTPRPPGAGWAPSCSLPRPASPQRTRGMTRSGWAPTWPPPSGLRRCPRAPTTPERGVCEAGGVPCAAGPGSMVTLHSPVVPPTPAPCTSLLCPGLRPARHPQPVHQQTRSCCVRAAQDGVLEPAGCSQRSGRGGVQGWPGPLPDITWPWADLRWACRPTDRACGVLPLQPAQPDTWDLPGGLPSQGQGSDCPSPTLSHWVRIPFQRRFWEGSMGLKTGVCSGQGLSLRPGGDWGLSVVS